MPEENGLQNIESAQGDDGGTTARTAWFHPRLTITRHALLVLVPIGLTAGVLNWAPIVTFFLNFFAIIPLAPSINVSTGRLAERTGPCFGGLLNVILGNAVEIIIGVTAVMQGQIEVARSSLIGSIVIYSLLILGICFLTVGYDKLSLDFNAFVTKTIASLMMASSISLILPTTILSTLLQSDYPVNHRRRDILILSRGTSIMLLILFVVYLYFQLKTHEYLFTEVSQSRDDANPDDGNIPDEEPQIVLGKWLDSCTLILAIFCTIGCSIYLIGSVDSLAETANVDKIFIGLVVIPFVGSTAQGLKIVLGARSIGVQSAVNTVITSVLQIGLLAAPLLVLVGWMFGQFMALDFDIFEATVLFLVIMVMNSIIQEGKATYFQGGMLMGIYIVIATAFYVRPKPSDDTTLTWLWAV